MINTQKKPTCLKQYLLNMVCTEFSGLLSENSIKSLTILQNLCRPQKPEI